MRHRIRIYGIVQGVGFRPTVARHASTYQIRGTVSNKGPFVEVVAEGNPAAVEAFEEAIRNRSPKRSVILKMDIEALEEKEPQFPDFQIIESEKTKGEILISPDIAICDDCQREMYEKGGRRYLHPFINCTCCGPRLTILDALPYDRERTSMKEFPMCPDCAEEYHTQEDRRYDAQPVCCNDCGPVVYLLGQEPDRSRQHDAIHRIRKTIAEGGIVAVKGIGGYHLCCDATSEAAVQLLRDRKKRPMKPFAVMMRDIETVRKNCEVTPEQEEILTGHQKPIILLREKEDSCLAPAVAPGNPKAGVMLPYAPIQLLLFDYDDGIRMPEALVMTSANTSGAPICRDEEDARRELSELCDEILCHNRKIRIRADDTVMDFYEGKPYMIRRSRGFAPLPVVTERILGKTQLPRVVLAIGGELKNTFCIRVGNLCYLSPYIGDMEDLRTVDALRETIERFKTLLEVEPEAVICDLHPRYNTVAAAEMLGLPVYRIQHHYAHILSCMAEQDEPGPVIGVSYDGTGYGTDGTIWGGEILLADTADFTREASIRPFLQIGGDYSAREGWRIALSMLYQLEKEAGDGENGPDVRSRTLALAEQLQLAGEDETKILMAMADRRMNAVTSTSMGRLFDAVSAILGIRRESTFEGEASTALQFAAEAFLAEHGDGSQSGHGADEDDTLYADLAEGEDGRLILPTDRLVAEITKRKLAGASAGELAYHFHREVARMTVRCCVRIREKTGENTVALSGGCYQNTLLLALTEEGLAEQGFRVLRHGMVPPNDGGIALGQAVWSGVHSE